MSPTFSNISLPVFSRGLTALSGVLDKAAAFAEAKKIDESVLLHTRLAPDMFNLMRQVQLACDFAKNGAARMAGVEPVKFEDHEKTIADLKARIAATLAYMGTLDTKAIDAADTRTIALPMRTGQTITFKGADFFNHFALPNFYFHSTAAYCILRDCGVEIGKRDFIGAAPSVIS